MTFVNVGHWWKMDMFLICTQSHIAKQCYHIKVSPKTVSRTSTVTTSCHYSVEESKPLSCPSINYKPGCISKTQILKGLFDVFFCLTSISNLLPPSVEMESLPESNSRSSLPSPRTSSDILLALLELLQQPPGWCLCLHSFHNPFYIWVTDGLSKAQLPLLFSLFKIIKWFHGNPTSSPWHLCPPHRDSI